MINMRFFSFEWDANKEAENIKKHEVDFKTAEAAFYDLDRVMVDDTKHSIFEKRYFCIGKVGNRILTVRFTSRNNVIRIIGAGFWRSGRKKYYEKENKK